MLLKLSDIGKDVQSKFNNYNDWQELSFNDQDKTLLGQLDNLSKVYNSSMKFDYGYNHAFIPSQYILYALGIKEFAIALKDHLDVFEKYKKGKDSNQIGDEILNRSFNVSYLGLDEYSQKIAMEPLINDDYNFNAKEIINGTQGKYKIRGTADFFASVILKIINVPDASSSILGKLIYDLTVKKELYNYLERRFLDYLPYLVQDFNRNSFAQKVFKFIYQYDHLDKIKDQISKNSDKSFSSIRLNELGLTSIFKSSTRLLSEDELMQGNKPRFFQEPIFFMNKEYYYFSTEWTDGTGSRLDIENFKLILKELYPEFQIVKSEQGYQLLSSSIQAGPSKKDYPFQAKNQLPRNKIIYGAPGTGKSYELREQAKRLGFDEKRMKRVTFHPNYSYQQFVGSYKPSPIYKEFQEESALYGSDKTTKLESLHKKEPMIDYSFVPGIFLELLIKALNNPNEDYLLIIEEINRAPVSAVFGDVFQLLDRDSHGVSQYEITFNTEAQNFIIMNGIKSPEIKLPNNFFIWATMNSADQGVLPLDAAFKRRWSFEYLPLDKKEAIVKDANVQFMGESLNWNSFRTKINEKLKSIGVAEDKLIGPFFLSENERNNDNAIKNKLLLYLRDDVVRHNPESLFRQKTFSDIIGAYDNGKNVFKDISFEMEKTEIKDAEGDPTE